MPVKFIGVDHVEISSDFDGGGGIDGLNSAAEVLNVTLELVRMSARCVRTIAVPSAQTHTRTLAGSRRYG
jgi:microsomal dipeptidase-like Zn-dependent dipeptidase